MAEQQDSDQTLTAPIDEIAVHEARPLTGLPALLALLYIRYIVRPRNWWHAWYTISIAVPQPDGSRFNGVMPKRRHPHFLLRRLLGLLGRHTDFTVIYWTREKDGEAQFHAEVSHVA